MLEYTPSHLSHCNNLFSNLVQTRGVKTCTSAAVSVDACPIWPQMRGFWAVWFVYMCISERGGRRRRPSFISYGDQIFYMIWCDMMWWHRPSYGMGLREKCDDRASGRLDCDLTSERGREPLCTWERERGGERERKRWGENDHGVREMRGGGMTGRVMPLKEMKMSKIVREN